MEGRLYEPYWASVPEDEIADNILDKVDDYYKFLTYSGKIDLYRRSYTYYYRPLFNNARLQPAGQQGELTAFSVNHYRNLLAHIAIMTTQQKIAFEPRATNTDAKSQAQTILATGLLDYYLREKRLEDNFVQSVQDCLMFAEGFIRVEWDATLGKKYGVTETGAIVYEGDLKFSNYSPLDTIRDFTKTNARVLEWYILRDFENKYNLAAKFPDIAQEILDDTLDMMEAARTTSVNLFALDESDNIPVYTLIHKPTPALPQGRYTQVLDNGTVMMDGPIPYDETHVYRVAPWEQSGTIFGFSVAFDLISIQEAIDILYSTAISNMCAFGVQNILIPKGHDIGYAQLTGGLNTIEYDPKVGKPEALNLTLTSPEIFNMINILETVAETISAVNSVARGNVEKDLSGVAMALVQSQAIQFNKGLERSYNMQASGVGTGAIKLLQTFANVPRVAEITGKANRPLAKQYSGRDLDLIDRVLVDIGNPIMNTTAGKITVADKLTEQGWIDSPNQYIQVLSTGRIEPIIERKQSQNILIKAENEGLSEGQAQRAMVTDNHPQHILEHSTVMDTPEARQDPNSPIAEVTMAHIQEHIEMIKALSINNPILLSVLHQPNVGGGFQAPPPPTQLPGENSGSNVAQAIPRPGLPGAPQGTDPRSAEIINQQQQVA